MPSRRLRIIDLIRPHWKALTIALVAVLGETLTDILEPWPIKIVVDNVLQSKKLPSVLGGIVTGLFGSNAGAVLYFAVAAVALIAIVGAVSSYVEKYLTTSVSQWVGHDLRRTLYHHIQRLSLAEHDRSRTGDLITRVTSDIGAVQDFINSALLGMLVNAMTLVGMIGVMLYLNWRFTLIALSIVPVLFLVVYYYTRRIKSASRAVRTQEGKLLSVVEEVLTSIRVVKAFAREDYEQQRFETESLANVEAGLQARSIKAKLSPVVEVLVAIGTCLVLWYGARLAMAGQLSAGVLIVFLLYLGKMYKPMVGQLYSSMYYGVFFALYAIPVLGTFLLVTRVPLRRMWLGVVAAAAIGLVLSIPLAAPYLAARQARGERGQIETLYYSATGSDYLQAHRSSYMYGDYLPGRHGGATDG